MTIDLTTTDIIGLAFAAGEAGTSASIDGRLYVAQQNHDLAARMWAAVGYSENARRHRELSYAAAREKAEALAEAED